MKNHRDLHAALIKLADKALDYDKLHEDTYNPDLETMLNIARGHGWDAEYDEDFADWALKALPSEIIVEALQRALSRCIPRPSMTMEQVNELCDMPSIIADVDDNTLKQIETLVTEQLNKRHI